VKNQHNQQGMSKESRFPKGTKKKKQKKKNGGEVRVGQKQ